MISLFTRKPLPEFTKMTVEPHMLESLLYLVKERHPLNILELGSGLSTVALAYQLEANGAGRLDALEHDAECAEKTRKDLNDHNLYPLATVHLAPIRNQVVSWDGMAYPWYSLAGIAPGRKFDFVFIDGPPSTLGHMARWPAYFLLKPFLMPNAVMVVDDMKRVHEKVMVESWMRADPHLYKTEMPTGRGGALLERRVEADPERLAALEAA